MFCVLTVFTEVLWHKMIQFLLNESTPHITAKVDQSLEEMGI